MTTVKVKDLIKEINDIRNPSDNRITYDTKSQKDELAVMKAMLNDKTYKVNIYGPDGVEGTICPSEVMINTFSYVIVGTTGFSDKEAKSLVDKYEFTTKEAKGLSEFSKEYINTYLLTGRKLPLGGRETSNVSLIRKTIPAGYVKYPVKVGEDKDGRNICESEETYVEQYHSIKVYGPCPTWIKNKSKKK